MFPFFKQCILGAESFKPVFSETRRVIVTDLFKPIFIQCQAHADPMPYYEWSRNTTVTSRADKINIGIQLYKTYTTLSIANISWFDRGIYVCNAWNSKGFQHKEYEIIINRK